MAKGSSLTDAVIASASACDDARLRRVFESLVRHLHAFVRDVELTPDEWLAGIRFLTATGQRCDDVRQEFILLSDTLGVTALVDEIAHGAQVGATASSVLGPFYNEHPPEIAYGASIAAPGKGIPLAVSGTVRGIGGEAVARAIVDVWETDADALYDSQHDAQRIDCRGRLRTADDGSFAFRGVVPKSYSIPTDGPVGALLERLRRGTFRPAHLHLRIAAPGYATLTTALYVAGDPYLASDAVFGVHPSLIEKFRIETGPGGEETASLVRDFVLATAR